LDEPDIEEETSWEFTNKPIIEVQKTELNSDQKKTFEKVVLPKIKEVSAKDINDLGECTLRKHQIRTQDVAPIFIQPYRKSMAEREVIKKEVEEMLKANIIEQSTSPWSSPVVLVPKKKGKKRFCVDFRKLNAVTITENWPLPRIEDIFDRLGDSKVFSTLDLKSGYWQMGLTDESKEKTAFSTPDGHYQFKRMPFGLKNAPADFSKLMYQILGNLPYVLAAKQVKRVDKLIEHYQWKDNQLLYKPNVEKEEYLVVPKRDERRDVIEKAHLLGHFQAEATAARVREKYFWRGMIKDIERIIKLCKQCKEYKVARIVDHPAKALEILSIFHRIGIDLVFGLPLTAEGYKGLLVIIEFVSKYVWAAPIKSKNAEEIAEKLLVYIALFGPSKEILSDQGTEFNNKVVEQLMKATGVVHRVTSAYNPRTNGQTERMNYVLVESLEKFTGENNLDWPKWLPYVLLSYNTKVHSSTGFTPFELMFGRKMNGFESWTKLLLF